MLLPMIFTAMPFLSAISLAAPTSSSPVSAELDARDDDITVRNDLKDFPCRSVTMIFGMPDHSVNFGAFA